MKKINYGRFISVYQSQDGGYNICILTPSINLCLVPTEVELALNKVDLPVFVVLHLSSSLSLS